MDYLFIILIGYLLGNFNMALFISEKNGIDLRSVGSKNPGASNATITMGWKVGATVALFDILKASLAVITVSYLFSDIPSAGVLAGASAVFGHMFPFYLNFKGGKGFASYIGTIIAYNWRLTLILAISIILITVITNYIPIATITTITAFPVYLYLTTNTNIFLFCSIVFVSFIIFIKHIPNLKRIIKGEEIGLRSTIKR